MKARLQKETKVHETRLQPLPTKVHEALLELLLKQVNYSFDQKSGTHIFYYSIAPGWVPRGIGEFPDGAYADFQFHAHELVKALSAHKAKSFIASIGEQRRAPKALAKEEPPPSVVQVGLSTSSALHRDVASRAKDCALSLNSFCVELIEREFPRLDQQAFDMPSIEVRKMIVAAKPPAASEKHDWVIRMPRELRARLLIFANEYRVTLPQLCMYLLGEPSAVKSQTARGEIAEH
ncbi:hypothetical protein XI07_18875 [Bradyrhizobium sp. CCBAU 11445]|uniref:hypothetical protein n=1 Tax=unclassified Bradyrhizobium TaxID=2631580 RepID=UPI002305E3C1|nr:MULTISPECIES: hypothetical protein [unclassified Bradyrhizobium]MDA9484038.1 hypothetical protein [Bradyrhizobium sp. CCBAU 11445]MDA9522361.1 hypothetical protein [Bradyrhizobium sp. CCBAU 11434]